MAGLIERTVLSLLSSRRNKADAGDIKTTTPIGVGAYLRLMPIYLLLYVDSWFNKVS